MAKRHSTDGRPTISEIARIAGVSVPTVSKVLNGRTDVAAPTRERVEQIIEEYGFVRNRAARALRKGKTGLVDLILPRLDDEYFLPILEGAAQVLREAGIRMILTSSHYEPEEEVHWINTDHSGDGILVVLPSEEAIEHLEHSGMPFVLIHNQGGLLSPAPSVRITSWEGGFVATNHLISLGHRRIAYIGKSIRARDAIERIAGYRAALDAAKIPIDPQLECDGNFSEADGYLATKTMFELPEPPTAIFAGNDRQAAGVYRALHELGKNVPEDVSVIGFDNLPFTELLSPPLTTIHAPRLELGRTAATMLLHLINGEPLEIPRVVLPTQFVERQSCRPLAP
ncbi:MAG TPA: LacI family DNA-binding transcriptional regulator [Ktedonobacteraceae bacterium]|jgi:DNA-binding LacI/PurR family transcriptional regulator|nr:LacI family DNA-binding transcriptional regulator [Ktedonobacteraceae bacterium]